MSYKQAKDLFYIGEIVDVRGNYSEKIGTIVNLDDDIPYKALVRLDHGQFGSTTCWIDIKNLS
jgi:hypothetical protein